MAVSAADQNFANHSRWLAPWHFFAAPVLAANVIIAAIAVFKGPGFTSGWWLAVSIALLIGVFTARIMPTKVQDRLIRLEETLRLNRLMAGREADVAKLTVEQLVGLRFAADGEVVGLVDRVLAGDLVAQKDIKQAVKTWRGDTLRV